MSEKEVLVPNIGDFKDVEVIEVLIEAGSNINKDDPIITIESDKSSVEIPSPYSGSVKKVNLKVGDKVSEGSSILIIGSEEEKPDEQIEEEVKEIKEETIIQKPPEKVISKPKEILKNNRVADFGDVEIQDIPRIKRIAAPHLSNSWQTIPHVTSCDEADITELEEFRQNLTDTFTGEKKKITPLAFIIKAVVEALKVFPRFNSSIDNIENGKITLKKYFHVGIAVDTPNGLMVPKIRNANQKNIDQISKDLKKVSDDCRNLKIDKKEFYGGSITITSLGGIGGTYFTPIINYPEVAILGIGRTYIKPVYIDGQFKPRTMLPLSLSYDHRIIDGAEGSRFNNELKNNLGKNFAYKLAKQ